VVRHLLSVIQAATNIERLNPALASGHRLKTLLNPLCQPENLISKHTVPLGRDRSVVICCDITMYGWYLFLMVHCCDVSLCTDGQPGSALADVVQISGQGIHPYLFICTSNNYIIS